MARAESDHSIFVPKDELLVPLNMGEEVILEEIRRNQLVNLPYSSSVKKILSLHLAYVPHLELDEDGETWRYHPNSVSENRNTMHASLSYDGLQSSTDGVIIRPDRNALITIGAINPESSEISIWVGLSTFNPNGETPDLSTINVMTIAATPHDAAWIYHCAMYQKNRDQN